MNITNLARQGLNKQLSSANQQPQQKVISEELKQVANYVFSKLTAMRPAWRNGFIHNGVLDEKLITNYKKSLLEGMELAGINSFEKVKKGLDKLLLEKGVFLPSVGDFVQACKDERAGEFNAAMYQEFRPNRLISSITEQERKDTALNEIEKIKAMLKVKK